MVKGRPKTYEETGKFLILSLSLFSNRSIWLTIIDEGGFNC